MKVVIRTDELSKHYGKSGLIKAVDELDLEVYKGENFGLLGPNGARARAGVLLSIISVIKSRKAAIVRNRKGGMN